MLKNFAYIIVVKFKNIRCKYYNNFISQSKCRSIKNGKFDNGRIIYAEEIEIVLTDIDFNFILDTYKYESYEIEESYYSVYDYLPTTFIKFVLEKYVNKTKFKNVEGMEVEYAKEKNKFNSLYGMSVTNTIRDEVIYDSVNDWTERELTNQEIISKLNEEKKKSFLSFAYGVWVTAHARNNLLRNVIKQDEYVVYCDTDCMKLKEGYNKEYIENYNKYVEYKIKEVSDYLKIPIEQFAPKDTKGKSHMLGVFEEDAKYDKFITQGAKKYATEKEGKIEITVAGVPKEGARALKTLDDFRDNLIFDYKITHKNSLTYCDNQEEIELTDYKGNKEIVTDKTACCIFPTTYKLGKALEYADLISDNSSKRAKYKE